MLMGAAASCPTFDFDGAKISDSPQSCKESLNLLREFKKLALQFGLDAATTFSVARCLRLLL